MLKATPVLRLYRNCELVAAVLLDRTPEGGIKPGTNVRPVKGISGHNMSNLHIYHCPQKAQSISEKCIRYKKVKMT